jgi:hypothetical protein
MIIGEVKFTQNTVESIIVYFKKINAPRNLCNLNQNTWYYRTKTIMQSIKIQLTKIPTNSIALGDILGLTPHSSLREFVTSTIIFYSLLILLIIFVGLISVLVNEVFNKKQNPIRI